MTLLSLIPLLLDDMYDMHPLTERRGGSERESSRHSIVCVVSLSLYDVTLSLSYVSIHLSYIQCKGVTLIGQLFSLRCLCPGRGSTYHWGMVVECVVCNDPLSLLTHTLTPRFIRSEPFLVSLCVQRHQQQHLCLIDRIDQENPIDGFSID